jgi:hypothetical protein
MAAERHTLPIEIEPTTSDMIDGTLEITGILSYEGGTFTVEYQTSFAGIDRSEVKQHTFHLSDLSDIELKWGMFRPKVILRAASLTTFQGIPGANEAELVLKIPRRAKAQAGTLVPLLKIEMGEGW